MAQLSSAGLAITYQVLSGPATVTGNVLTLTGSGTVVVEAIQAGNGTYASTSLTQTFTASPAASGGDSPTLPTWGLVLLAAILFVLGARFQPVAARISQRDRS